MRTVDEGLAVARAVAGFDRLRLCGVEGYEGLIVGPDPQADGRKVEAYLATVLGLFRQCRSEDLFSDTGEILLSAAGPSISTWWRIFSLRPKRRA
ncbi:MAG: hypothetical protein WDN06_02050 [Asticcacaulis sp.]